MRLFGRGDKSDKYAASDAIAQAEVARLVALAPAELGAEMVAAFGPDGVEAKGKLGVGPMQIIEWLMRSAGRGVSTKPLVPVVLAAVARRPRLEARPCRERGCKLATSNLRPDARSRGYTA